MPHRWPRDYASVERLRGAIFSAVAAMAMSWTLMRKQNRNDDGVWQARPRVRTDF
jgi:hypothetical protein